MKCCHIGCDKKATKGIYGEQYQETFMCDEHVDEYTSSTDTILPIE